MAGKTKTVVLLSGGLDSTVLLAERRAAGREVLPISFHYNQRHSVELEAAARVARYYDCDHQIIDLSALGAVCSGSGSSQIYGELVAPPEGHYADESMKVTVVPNRNMTLLALATAYAISNGAAEVAYAAHAGDHAVYPDCRSQFVDSIRRTIALCDYPTRVPLLYTPFLSLSKAEVVVLGDELHAPLELTYSCYVGEPDIHCGRCGTCVERREAFTLAGVPDPTRYVDAPTAA